MHTSGISPIIIFSALFSRPKIEAGDASEGFNFYYRVLERAYLGCLQGEAQEQEKKRPLSPVLPLGEDFSSKKTKNGRNTKLDTFQSNNQRVSHCLVSALFSRFRPIITLKWEPSPKNRG